MPNRAYERYMRDMAMRDMAMRARNMRAMRMDGRNPYGSAGGYVSSRGMDSASNRNYRNEDYARRNFDRADERRGGGYDRADERRGYDRDSDQNYDRGSDYTNYRNSDYANYRNSDYARRGSDYANYRNSDMGFDQASYRDGIEQYYNDGYPSMDYGYDRHLQFPYSRGLYGYYGDTPFEVNRKYEPGMFQDYGMDYGEDSEYLSKEKLEKWTRKLLEKVEDKELFAKDKILKKAEEMGIKFEKVTPDEFYATVIMAYTDHHKTFGNAVDTYIRVAKDWLMDDDVEKKYGKKLAAYYKNIVKDDD